MVISAESLYLLKTWISFELPEVSCSSIKALWVLWIRHSRFAWDTSAHHTQGGIIIKHKETQLRTWLSAIVGHLLKEGKVIYQDMFHNNIWWQMNDDGWWWDCRDDQFIYLFILVVVLLIILVISRLSVRYITHSDNLRGWTVTALYLIVFVWIYITNQFSIRHGHIHSNLV